MIDINEYCHFVRSTTSQPSLDVRDFSGKMYELNNWFVSPQILTAVIGMQSETGEFAEIVKKIIFQGKEMTNDQRYHTIRVAGRKTQGVRLFDVDEGEKVVSVALLNENDDEADDDDEMNDTNDQN